MLVVLRVGFPVAQRDPEQVILGGNRVPRRPPGASRTAASIAPDHRHAQCFASCTSLHAVAAM